MPPKLISVVIPAYNEEQNIALCLAALVQQSSKIPMEVIVVDNNCTDGTARIVRGFSHLMNVRVIREKKKGRGAARKKGFDSAKGEIIFSTDADTIVPSDWVEKTLAAFKKDKSVVAVTGFTRIVDCDAITNLFFNVMMPLHMKAYRIIGGHFILSGFNFAITKKAYDAAGGFNAMTDAYEDFDLSDRVYKSKTGKIRLIEEAPVIFSGRRFKRGLLRGYMDYVTTFTAKVFMGKERVLLRVVDNKGNPVDNTGALIPAFHKLMRKTIKSMEKEILTKIPLANSLINTKPARKKKRQ